MSNEIITKTEAATRWEVGKSTVTFYIGKGLPVREDGRLDWQAADEWRQSWITPERSGSYYFRQEEKFAKRTVPVTTAIQAINLIHGQGMGDLIAICVALGMTPAMQRAAVYIGCAWAWNLFGEEAICGCGADGPAVNYSGLEGIKLSERELQQSDAWIEVVDEINRLKT